MFSELLVILIVEAFDRRVFNGSVHPLHLAIRPRVVGLRQPVLDTMRIANHVEAHGAGVNLISVPGLICELDPIISEYGVDPLGHGFEEMFQELPSGFPISFVDQLGHCELARSVNANKEIQPIVGKTIPRIVFCPSSYFCGLHLGYIDMEEADRVAFELLPFGLVVADVLKPRNPVPL